MSGERDALDGLGAVDGLGGWEGVRPVQWVRAGSGLAAIAYLGHLVACAVTWPTPIGDPIGEAITFLACAIGFVVAPRRPALGAALACGSVGAEVFVAAAIVPTEWVAALPVQPVVVLAVGIYFGANAALWASGAAMAIYPLVMVAARKMGPAVGGIPPHELSRMVVFEGAVAGAGVMTFVALKALSRAHADVEARRRLEHRLLNAQRLQVVGELAGVAAHDFKNVLGVFQNTAAARERSSDPEARELGAELARSARSGRGIAARLLSLARGAEAQRKVIDVAATVEELRPLVARLVGPRCALALHVSGPAVATADPSEVEQIVLNLAANARDAMAGGGTVSVRVRGVERSEAEALGSTLTQSRQVLLEVADEGHGIPEELHERIFEPFVTTKGPGEGTGLGLATVRAIASSSGGAVALRSAPGEGAIFRVFLPEAVRPPAELEAAR